MFSFSDKHLIDVNAKPEYLIVRQYPDRIQ